MNFSSTVGTLSWGDYSKRGVVGSLLDDNQWHDVELTRQDKNVTVSVDRVPVNVTVEGEFTRLDLDRYVSYYIVVVCCNFLYYITDE